MPFRTVFRCVFVALACMLCTAVPAAAAPVLVMREDGSVVPHGRSLAPAETFPPVRSSADQRRSQAVATLAAKRKTVPGELEKLRAAGAIDDTAYAERRAAYDDAKRTVKKLSGRRKLELGAVVKTLEDVAARGQLTASRLPALFLTLQRNREWWTTGPLLSSGRRVGFDGSQIVWQYYPGAGIQIQVLGTFGKVNALWSSRQNTALGQAVDELLPLAAERAGGLAWEYYFDFGGGAPPWVSGLAQGTGLQAMARAAVKAGRGAELLPWLRGGLGIFRTAPPEGVQVAGENGGAHFLQYSFAPGLEVLNGFVQSLVGLYDFGQIAGDAEAQALFAAGEASARAEVPAFDTGAWSLYSRGTVTHESDLGYHTLLRDFLESLCNRIGSPVYCDAEQHFTTYLTTDPVVRLDSRRLRGGTYGRIKMALDKISGVTLRITRGEKLVHTRYVGNLSRGSHTIGWRVPRRAGDYTVTLAARDLAGNPATATGDIEVLKPRKKKRG